VIRVSILVSNDTPIEVYMVVLPGNKHVLLYDVDAS
jgi:hypothetical protein